MHFGKVYDDHQRSIAQALREARSAGATRYQTTHSAREVDPSRLTDRAIDLIALREAERYTQRAVNQHNETKG